MTKTASAPPHTIDSETYDRIEEKVSRLEIEIKAIQRYLARRISELEEIIQMGNT